MKLRTVSTLVLVAALVSGCASLKRCAYAGGGRDDWQQKERVVAALRLTEGSSVADLGAGGGYFTFDLAEAVGPRGRVYAVDVDEDMLAYLAEEAQSRGLGNVTPVRAGEDSPRLPEPVDLIFISNTYHHLADRTRYFERARDSLRPGGRIAIVEYDGRNSGFFGLFADHATEPERIRREMEEAGYRVAEETDFLERQSFTIFEPEAGARRP